MSQDIVSDTLNRIMNAKRARKEFLIVNKTSKLLINVLDIAKQQGNLDYTVEGNNLKINIKNINEIKAIKPRYTVSTKNLDGYIRRYLPAKNFGFLIVSTDKGLMIHKEAQSKNLGGCLIAYIF